MVHPVGLIDDIKGQSQVVNTTIDQVKDFAINFGKDTGDSQRTQIDAQAFHDLVMKRGRE